MAEAQGEWKYQTIKAKIDIASQINWWVFPGLCVDDLGDVLEETLCSSTKWYNIGLRLKVPVAKLDSIKSQFSDPGECLREVLKEWLKGAAGTKPAWGVLVEALRSQTVGETQLADQLEVKHCQTGRSSQGMLCMSNYFCVWLQLSLSFVHFYPITQL